MTGSGDDVIHFQIPGGDAAAVHLTYSGTRNFIVVGYDSLGGRTEALVNEIGAYDGRVPVNFVVGDEVAELEITSSGSWTITAEPLSLSPVFDGALFQGRGDEVILIAGDFGRLSATHNGESNFIVTAYGSDGRDGLINEIGAYSGTVRLGSSSVVLVVQADGDWTLEGE